MSVSQPMIASSSVPTLKVATIAAALRDSLNSDNRTCDGMLMYVNIDILIFLLSHSALQECLLITAVLMVVLLLTTLNNASVLQDMLSTLNNALVCKPPTFI